MGAYLGVRDCFLKWSPREIVGVEKYEKRKHMTGKNSGKDPKAERNSMHLMMQLEERQEPG